MSVDEPPSSRMTRVAPYIALGTLLILVAARLGAFNLMAEVRLADGTVVLLPNVFAGVDHPFHAVRANTVLEILRNGAIPRWIDQHHGGYPLDFYPPGLAWIEATVWAAAFGHWPIIAIHKLVVILVFLLPAVGFLLVARQDRISPWVAVLATAIHVSVAGFWTSGGYGELVQWGLATNVTAATLNVLALAATIVWLRNGRWWAFAIASGAAGVAVLTNPRSVFALLAIGIGVAIAALIERNPDHPVLVRRGAAVALVSAMIGAPEIIGLVRFNDLYHFIHYTGYADLQDFATASIRAVSGPVMLVALAGLGLGLARPLGFATRSAAWTLAIYSGGTAAGIAFGDSAAVQQLELTRLMPFQRLLMIMLAATATWWAISRLTRISKELAGAVIGVVALGVVLLHVVAPPGFIPESDRSLFAVPTTATPEFAYMEQAVTAADDAAPAGSALLVLGHRGGWTWHDQLWAPLWTNRPVYYDDWLWYWQSDLWGPYDPATEHALPRDADGLTADFFSHHGIGAVVVIGEAAPDAASSPLLALVSSFDRYDVYRVIDPGSTITLGSRPLVSTTQTGQELTVRVPQAGTLTIRQNIFPRWNATLNGDPVTLEPTEDGYISARIDRPGTLRLVYQVEPMDWMGRIAFVSGWLLVAGLGLFQVRAKRK